MKYDTITYDKTEGRENLPKWMRTIMVTADDEYFFPVGILGNEQKLFMCAAFDSVSVITHLNHIYLSAEWLKREGVAVEWIDEAVAKLKKNNIRYGTI